MGRPREPVFGRLAEYEDVNDVNRLASSDNLAALVDLLRTWIDCAHGQRSTRSFVFDADRNISLLHSGQEGTAYEGYFSRTCDHSLFVFNRFGDLKRCALRPGNVHSADGCKDALEPGVACCRERNLRRYFRADAVFANPEVYECLEAEGYKYTILLPENRILRDRIGCLLKRFFGRPPLTVRRHNASFSYRAASWVRPRRVVTRVPGHPHRPLVTSPKPGRMIALGMFQGVIQGISVDAVQSPQLTKLVATIRHLHF